MVFVATLDPDGSHTFPYVSKASRDPFGVEPDDLMRDVTRMPTWIV